MVVKGFAFKQRFSSQYQLLFLSLYLNYVSYDLSTPLSSSRADQLSISGITTKKGEAVFGGTRLWFAKASQLNQIKN